STRTNSAAAPPPESCVESRAWSAPNRKPPVQSASAPPAPTKPPPPTPCRAPRLARCTTTRPRKRSPSETYGDASRYWARHLNGQTPTDPDFFTGRSEGQKV